MLWRMEEKKCVNRNYFRKMIKRKGSTRWSVNVTLCTFLLAVAFSFISQVATAGDDVLIAIMMLLLMIIISIIFDGIGIAAASCDLDELRTLHFGQNGKVNRIACDLVKNAGKVNNVCSDVIGDMCGILCGACGMRIAMQICSQGSLEHLVGIAVSSMIIAFTVGGKAFLKGYAVDNASEYMMLTARMIAIFSRKNKKRKGKAK